MSASERPSPQHYGDIIVVGGGCYGSYYVRQLRRARAAGGVDWERLVVVDRDPECSVSGDAHGVELVTREWGSFFDAYLGAAADRAPVHTSADLGADAPVVEPWGTREPEHAIVPSPLMPHLMAQWVVSRARARWPGRMMRLRGLDGALDVPWQRAGGDGTHYVSFAQWECPINCVEPRRCPHTRGTRAWSLPPTVRSFVETERLRGRSIEGPALCHCVHRAYGVGMFGVEEVLAADRLVARAAAGRPASVLLGTVSHCHGALMLLEIGAA